MRILSNIRQRITCAKQSLYPRPDLFPVGRQQGNAHDQSRLPGKDRRNNLPEHRDRHFPLGSQRFIIGRSSLQFIGKHRQVVGNRQKKLLGGHRERRKFPGHLLHLERKRTKRTCIIADIGPEIQQILLSLVHLCLHIADLFGHLHSFCRFAVSFGECIILFRQLRNIVPEFINGAIKLRILLDLFVDLLHVLTLRIGIFPNYGFIPGHLLVIVCILFLEILNRPPGLIYHLLRFSPAFDKFRVFDLDCDDLVNGILCHTSLYGLNSQ